MSISGVTLATRSSYWQLSRAPRYSLLFALPLFVFYELLAVFLAHGERSVRNGADVILQSLFTAVAGAWGPPLFMLCLIGGGLWLVVRDMRAHGTRLRGATFVMMLGESVALALVFGLLVAGVTSGVLGLLQTLALPAGRQLDGWTRLMVSLGAGIYEELLFRVLLVGALAASARAARLARRDRWRGGDRRWGGDLLGLPLYRPVRRPVSGVFVRVSDGGRAVLLRAVPRPRVWDHGVDARAVRCLAPTGPVGTDLNTVAFPSPSLEA